MRSESLHQRLDRWRLEELLQKYRGLRLRPSAGNQLRIVGAFEFQATAAGKEAINDSYDVEILLLEEFPNKIPTINEIGGRIPRTFHKLEDGSLCLGSPTRLRLMLFETPTLLAFVERALIPYLYSRSYYERHGTMPFGELEHGVKGLLQDVADLFLASGDDAAIEYVRVSAMTRRQANKERCPCSSGRRLGTCHHRSVNMLRDRLGRAWFQMVFRNLSVRLD